MRLRILAGNDPAGGDGTFDALVKGMYQQVLAVEKRKKELNVNTKEAPILCEGQK